MKTTKKQKDFDCVALKNAIQAEIHEETKNMTFEELRSNLDAHLAKDPFWQRIKNHTDSPHSIATEPETYTYKTKK